MENVLFEYKEIKLNKGHLVENKTKIMHRVLEIQQISLLNKYMKCYVYWTVHHLDS